MQCHSCGVTIPSNLENCPRCGVRIDVTSLDRGTPVHDSTPAPLSPDQEKTTIGSSSLLRAASEQNQPKQHIPYRSSSPKVNRIRLGIGLGLLVLVLIGGGLFLLRGQSKKMDTQRSTLLQNPYPSHLGTLVLNNPLSWNSNGYYHWYEGTFSNGDGCEFMGGAYHVITHTGMLTQTCLVTGNFTNFAYQVQMKIARGSGGGIIFRANPIGLNYYYLYFDKTGHFSFIFYNNMYITSLAKGHSSAFYTGINQTNLVAVVVIEHSIVLYVNSRLLISISNITYGSGNIGVGATGAADANAQTEVAFSNAKAWMIVPTSSQSSAAAALSATAIRTAITSSQNPYPPFNGALALNDPLSNNNKSYAWDVLTDKTDSCNFRGGAYHVTESVSNTFFICNANSINFNGMAYQVQMEIIKGDRGGITFRSDAKDNNFYYFNINKSGAYALDIYNSQGYLKTLSSGTVSAFQSGLNQTNLIAVVAQGHTIDLYVNLQFIVGVSDSSYGNGEIGVVADDEGSATEVVFSNAKVWKL